jgi:DNA polymerase-3 subunit delta
MDASVKKIISALKAGRYEPVYFLQGEEPYFIDLIAGYIEANALNDTEKSFNQVVVYGKDVTMVTILTHARRFPMMAERQVVLVKEAQEIQDINKEQGSRLLLDYLRNPVPSTVLVFCHKHKNLDKRKELGKTIDKLAETITGKKLSDNQLPDFVSEYAAYKKIVIDSESVMALCELVGNDLSRLTNEFDKLLISLKPGEGITRDKVFAEIGISKEYNIFELQRAIVRRDTQQTFRIVRYMAGNTKRNPVIPVVAFLYSFFSKLMAASVCEDKSEKGLASALKINPYAARDYTIALRLYPSAKIVEIIHLLKETDLKLKGVNSGSATDGELLTELVGRIIY